MNRYIQNLIMAFFFFGLYASVASAEQNGPGQSAPENTVLQFFDASQNGDVEQMRALISGSYYNRRKAVLENNDSYPAFLVEHFQNSTTTIEKSDIDRKNQVAVVIVTTRFPDQSVNTSRLILKMDDSGIWKIVDEK